MGSVNPKISQVGAASLFPLTIWISYAQSLSMFKCELGVKVTSETLIKHNT